MEVHTFHKLTPANLYESFPDRVVFFLHTHTHTHWHTYIYNLPSLWVQHWSCPSRAHRCSLDSQSYEFEAQSRDLRLWMKLNYIHSHHPPTAPHPCLHRRQTNLWILVCSHCYSLCERNNCSYLSLLSHLQGESEIIDLMSFSSK